LAHFTALSLMKGTQQHTFQQIYEMIETVGANLGFGAGGFHTNFSGRALAEDLPMLVSILSECIRQPVFPSEQVERLRAQLLSGLAIRDQDTEDRASIRFDKIIFGDHPYGNPGDGFTETIQAISRQDIASFHQDYFNPRGMVIVIVGAVEPDEAIDVVSRAFNGWDYQEIEDIPHPSKPKPLKSTVREHIYIPGKSQVDIVMGTLGPDRKSPHFHAASLGNNILGQFGMMGRIGDVVREKAGLAYHASTDLNALMDTGSWEISAGVNPANVDQAIALILEELRRFTREPVTSEELQDSQTDYIGKIPLAFESNSGVANALLNIERFDLGLGYYRDFPNIISSIRIEDILLAAKTYIDPEKLAIISAGPNPGNLD
jgi:zinc protease